MSRLIDLTFCDHARKAMLRRQVSENEALIAATDPDRMTFAPGFIVNCFKVIDKRTIRVTFNAFESHVVTVSVVGSLR